MTKTPTPDEVKRAAEEAAREAEPRLRITPVSKIPVKATEWLWDQRIPLGALTLLPGREGTGKSTFGAWLAARVTKGELPGVYEGIPKSVFYVATEDDWSRTIAPRLRAAGADLERVYKIAVEVAGGLVGPFAAPARRAAARRHPQARGGPRVPRPDDERDQRSPGHPQGSRDADGTRAHVGDRHGH